MNRPRKVVLVTWDKLRTTLNLPVVDGNKLQTSSRLPAVHWDKLQTTTKLRAVRGGIVRIVNNTIISFIGQIVTWMSTLLLLIAYGRFLGDFKFGELYTAITLVLLIGFPIEVGFNQQIIRDVAQKPYKARSYLANTLLLKFVLWLILYGLILLISWLLGYSVEVRVLVAICGCTLLSTAIVNTFASVFYAFERVFFPAVGMILEKGLSALVGIILLEHGADVSTMAFVLLGGSVVSALWHVISFMRLMGPRLVFDLPTMRELIRTSIPFLAYGALTVIYYRLDTILLSIMTSAAVVGWYGAGYRLFDTLVFLPSLIIRVVFPTFSKLSISSDDALKRAIEKSTNFLLFFGIPITVGLIVTAPNIVAFLYHRAEFSHSIPALQALAPGLIFLYLNMVFNTTIVSVKREKKMTIMATIALFFNLALNLILIPLYQHVGAALVTSLTELLLLFLSIIFTPKHLLPLASLRVGAKAIVASSVMALAIWVLGLVHVFTLFAILPVAMVVYFATATLLRTISRADIQVLYRAIRRKGQSSASASAPPGHQQ